MLQPLRADGSRTLEDTEHVRLQVLRILQHASSDEEFLKVLHGIIGLPTLLAGVLGLNQGRNAEQNMVQYKRGFCIVTQQCLNT